MIQDTLSRAGEGQWGLQWGRDWVPSQHKGKWAFAAQKQGEHSWEVAKRSPQVSGALAKLRTGFLLEAGQGGQTALGVWR